MSRVPSLPCRCQFLNSNRIRSYSEMTRYGGKLRNAVLCLLMLVGGATGLKNLKITVPERVRIGDSALLTCSYDLESALLYMIQWYVDESEFYRYVPKEDPPHVTFPERNIKVNVSTSGMQDVTLVNVSRDMTGRYKCEVTEDAPLYDTQIKQGDMLVVDVPETDPRIAVDKTRLPADETLRANCTSGASIPAPNITWTLNGEPLGKNMQFTERSKTVQARAEKRKTQSSLAIKLSSNLFQDGKISLRCFAHITPVYRASAELEITEDIPLIASITGDASTHSRQSSGCSRIRLFSAPGEATMMSLTLLLVGLTATR